MNKKQRFHQYASAALAICMAAAIVYFTAFLNIHAYHECEGEGCDICYDLQTAKRIVSQITAKAGSLAAVFAFLPLIVLPGIGGKRLPLAHTLVTEKVRLNR